MSPSTPGLLRAPILLASAFANGSAVFGVILRISTSRLGVGFLGRALCEFLRPLKSLYHPTIMITLELSGENTGQR